MSNKVYRSVKYGMFVRNKRKIDSNWMGSNEFNELNFKKGEVFRVSHYNTTEQPYCYPYTPWMESNLPPIDGTLWIDIPYNVYKVLDKVIMFSIHFYHIIKR
jgi:hypothetical protein